MKKFALLAFLALPVFAFSQTKAITEFGTKVILNNDGTWKLAEATKDDPGNVPEEEICKYLSDKTDEYTNVRSVSIGGDFNENAGYRIVGYENGFTLHVHFETYTNSTIYSGTPIYVKFEDGKILEYWNEDSEVGRINKSSPQKRNYFTYFKIPKKDMTHFLNKKIMGIKWFTIEEKPTPDNAEMFKVRMACVNAKLI